MAPGPSIAVLDHVKESFDMGSSATHSTPSVSQVNVNEKVSPHEIAPEKDHVAWVLLPPPSFVSVTATPSSPGTAPEVPSVADIVVAIDAQLQQPQHGKQPKSNSR